jgi:hypothetical protein
MKALIGISRDGGRHMLMTVPKHFDTQAWANSRKDAFALLEIVRIVEEGSNV